MKILSFIRGNPIALSIFYDIQKYNTLSSFFKDYAYATVSVILKKLEEEKLIRKTVEGRKKIIYYTKKGLSFLSKLKELNEILEDEKVIDDV